MSSPRQRDPSDPLYDPNDKYNEYKVDLADPLAMAVMIDESETVYKNCKVKIIMKGEKRGRDTYEFIDSGKIKLASKVSRSKFLNILRSSLEL